jgi:hypothetical protein
MNKYKRGSTGLVILISLGVVIAVGAGWYVWQYKGSPAAPSGPSNSTAALPSGSNCGTINMDEYLKDPLNYGEETFACYGRALVTCSPTKMTYSGGGYENFVYEVEGRSGEDCVTSDTGGINLATQEKRGGFICSFPAKVGPEMFDAIKKFYERLGQSGMVTEEKLYTQVWARISSDLIYEGSNTLTVPANSESELKTYSANCQLK